MQIILGPVMRLKMWLNGAVKLASASNGSHSDQDGAEDINGITTSLGFDNVILFLVCVCVCVCVPFHGVCISQKGGYLWVVKTEKSKEIQDIWQKLKIYVNIKQGRVRMCAPSYPTLCDPTDCSPPDSSVHEIFQTRILEWVAISSSRGSSNLGIEPMSPTLAGRLFTIEPPWKPHQTRPYWVKCMFRVQFHKGRTEVRQGRAGAAKPRELKGLGEGLVWAVIHGTAARGERRSWAFYSTKAKVCVCVCLCVCVCVCVCCRETWSLAY